jgi:hypothetical protein
VNSLDIDLEGPTSGGEGRATGDEGPREGPEGRRRLD